MTILGIDPGTARMGWGVINVQDSKFKIQNLADDSLKGKKREEAILKLRADNLNAVMGNVDLVHYGCVATEKELAPGTRLIILRKELSKLIEFYKPELVVIERLFFGVNAKTAISVGQAIGVILLTVSEHEVPTMEYTGLQVKLMVGGHGRADKKVVQERVREILNFDKDTLTFSAKDHAWDDAADALAIAICHILK